MRRFASQFLMLSLCSLSAAAENERVWTNVDGRSMRAQFVREVDGEAVFLKDGKPVTVPLEKLSEPDRKYIHEQATSKTSSDNGGSTPENPFQPVNRPGTEPAENPFPPGDRAPSLTKKKTPIVSRDWIYTDGIRRYYGTFVRVNDRTVIINRPGPRTEILQFDWLSAEDQSYVNTILMERGERPLTILPLARGEGSQPFGGTPPFDQYPQAPLDSSGGNNRPAGLPGNSQFFQELRKRQEERRQEQARYAAETPEDSAFEASGADATEQSKVHNQLAVSPPSIKENESAAPAARPRPPVFTIDAKTLAELKPVFVVGAVVIGLFAVIGFIVFIATTIAGNSTRRQRYL